MNAETDNLQQRAEQQDAEAQFELARRHRSGEIDGASPQRALIWCRKAAVQGHAGAQRMLGQMYLEGDGVMQDDDTAREWLQKAAASGDSAAQQLLDGG